MAELYYGICRTKYHIPDLVAPLNIISGGVYFYRLESKDFVDVKRMILIK